MKKKTIELILSIVLGVASVLWDVLKGKSPKKEGKTK